MAVSFSFSNSCLAWLQAWQCMHCQDLTTARAISYGRMDGRFQDPELLRLFWTLTNFVDCFDQIWTVEATNAPAAFRSILLLASRNRNSMRSASFPTASSEANEHEKSPLTFHYSGCLIGILILFYNNPHMT